jgi:DNA-binding NtrC family response regulator
MLRKLEAAPAAYDLIVTDYAMPLVSGTDALKQARQIRPDMPGIIISGYADSRSMTDRPCEVVVLTKPFTLDQMRAAICTVVAAPAAAAAAP